MEKRQDLRVIASAGVLFLVALLAACGQTTQTATNGAAAGLNALKTPLATPSAANGAASPTDVPLPYTFPKQWLPAPDGADLPQWPQTVGGFAFSQSSPKTGYFCVISPGLANDSPAVPPVVSVTSDGGQTWQQASGSASRYKTACQIYIDQSDPKDVFVAAGNPLTQEQLYRSQDGGATWHTIALPNLNIGTSLFIGTVAVVQSRIIIVLGIDGEGSLPNPLYASDNGGVSWNPISMYVNGQNQQLGQQLWISGTILIAAAGGQCLGPCGALQAPIDILHGKHRLNLPLSSQPMSPILYYRSSDGGRNWTAIATPVSSLSNLNVARSTDGSTTYIIGAAQGIQGQPTSTRVAFYSKDLSASWRQLPTLAGVENGYLDPGSLGNTGLFVMPDGSVITTADHLNGTQYSGDAGAFLLIPGNTSPTWQPLIMLTKVSFMQAVATSTGVRVWGIEPALQGQPAGSLVYFDLP